MIDTQKTKVDYEQELNDLRQEHQWHIMDLRRAYQQDLMDLQVSYQQEEMRLWDLVTEARLGENAHDDRHPAPSIETV